MVGEIGYRCPILRDDGTNWPCVGAPACTAAKEGDQEREKRDGDPRIGKLAARAFGIKAQQRASRQPGGCDRVVTPPTP